MSLKPRPARSIALRFGIIMSRQVGICLTTVSASPRPYADPMKRRHMWFLLMTHGGLTKGKIPMSKEERYAEPSDYVEVALPPAEPLTPTIEKYLEVCEEKLGLVPNVIKAHLFSMTKLEGFIGFYNELMLGDSGLSKTEREMIAVVVSSINHCHYCEVAHGAALREMTGDPHFAETLAANYRCADLNERVRAMLDFAVKMTRYPDAICEADRQALRDAGFSDCDIWDAAQVASFFNMSNRMSTAVGMKPNSEYQARHRS